MRSTPRAPVKEPPGVPTTFTRGEGAPHRQDCLVTVRENDTSETAARGTPVGPVGTGPTGVPQDEETLKLVKSQRAGLPSVETISTP